MLTEQDKMLIRALQEDLPMVERPFEHIGAQVGMCEEEVIQKVRAWKANGTIRRVGGMLAHRRLGIRANAMVVWQVETNRIEEIGQIMAVFPEVTHCYQRPSLPDWPFNLFTMVHGKTPGECEEVAKRLSEQTGIKEYQLLYSTREWKKATMKYFEDGPAAAASEEG